MALKMCPDCGKKVSSRADKCPDCGCPAEYFEELAETRESSSISPAISSKDNQANSESQLSGTQKLEDNNIEINKEEILKSFTILGRTISYPKSTFTYIELIRKHQDDALRFKDAIEDIYDKAGNLDQAWHDVVGVTRAQAEVVLEDNIRTLYGFGLNVQREYFTLNGADIEPYINDALKRYSALLTAEETLKEQREYERAGRSKWTGGGFGIRGALKGAAKAAALNAVTGVGRAIGDSAVNGSDKAAIAQKKKELYKNKKDIQDLAFALSQVISTADWLTAAIYAAGDDNRGLSFELISANRNFISAVKYENSPRSLALRCIDILEEYPLVLDAYTKILDVIPEEDLASKKEVIDMISFWNAEYYFRDIIRDFSKVSKVQGFLDRHSELQTWKSDYERIDYVSYVKAKRAVISLKEECGSDCLQIQHPFTEKLKLFFDKCRQSNFLEGKLLNLLSDKKKYDLETIFSVLQEEREFLPELLKGIWIEGDENNIDESKLLIKWKLPSSEKIYLYKNSALFGALFGGVGFMVTDHYICDLKTTTTLEFSPEMTIEKIDEGSKIAINLQGIIIIMDLGEQDRLSRSVVFDLLYFIRGQSQSQNQNQKVIQRNNSSSDKIFCPFCGERILRTTKFCNYCGEKNTYQK